MITIEEVERIASGVAKDRLGEDLVIRVLGQPAANSAGEDALSITMVIEPGAINALGDPAFLEVLVNLHQKLQQAGEERFPIIEYATEQELGEDAGSES